MSALPRRPFLGIRVQPEQDGLRVTGVLDNATAARSGVCVDDRLTDVNGAPIRGTDDLVRELRASPTPVLGLVRGGAAIHLEVSPVPFPTEPRCSLGEVHVDIDGRPQRWRTLTTHPETDHGWALVFLGGIHVASLERHGTPTPLDHVLAELARAVMTVRVERGVGDSEGPGPDGIDFETEHRAYLSTVEALHREGRSVLLLGHSIGGMHAPRLPAAARVVFGTSAARWSDCLAWSTRRQLRLRQPEADTEDAERSARRFETDALRERPHAFHLQLDALDLSAAWRACREPTLVMHGEYDWVVGRAESERIVECAPDASLVPVVRTDHAFSQHRSRKASLEDYGRGRPSQAVVEHIVTFLEQQRR